MGVTLERVQNKFACIIGELCSEPLLLSQFAIWVDLRISEYKSKGTISLDCSGTSPDPSWLKGHANPGQPGGDSSRGRGGSSASIRNSLPHKSIHSSRDSSRVSHSLYQNNNRNTDNIDNSEAVSERLSPDVIIKDDPDAVFPISIHKHEARSPGVRKRVADPSYSGDQDLSQQGENFYQDSSFSTPSKMRRVDSASDDVAVDSPSNQSFMSVIGDSLQDSEDTSQIDNSLLTPSVGVSQPGNQRFSSPSASFSPMPSTSATPGSSGGPVPDATKSLCVSKVVDSPNTAGGLPFIDWQTQTPTQHDQAWFIGRQSKRNIRARVVMSDDKAESTIRGMVNVVGILERFLQVRFNDMRRCEIIPPAELDAYLVSFFLELRKPDGRDYDPYSLSNLRSYLDRFLREHNYPYSIGVSALFTASQQAFTRKRRSLLAVRSSQKELELQVEQSLFGPPMKTPTMDLESWKFLYSQQSAEVLSHLGNQSWVDASKVDPNVASEMLKAEILKNHPTECGNNATNALEQGASSNRKDKDNTESGGSDSKGNGEESNSDSTLQDSSMSEQRSVNDRPVSDNEGVHCVMEEEAPLAGGRCLIVKHESSPESPSVESSTRQGTISSGYAFRLTTAADKKAFNKGVQSRIKCAKEKSASTVRNMANSVGTVERWLQEAHGDFRPIETLSPAELDKYLASFFWVLKKPDGTEYDPDSFTGFRSYLDRFLKELEYPCTLSKSSEFLSCQEAFRSRRNALKDLSREKKKAEYMLSMGNISIS